MPSAAPSTFAVTTPTRRPVYGPGPTPTAMPVRSRGDTPASAMIFAIDGASSSAWRCASTVTSWASGWPPSWSATVTAGVAGSSPSSSTTNERSAPPAADRPASAPTAPSAAPAGAAGSSDDLGGHFAGDRCRGGGEVAHRHRPVLLRAGGLVEALDHRRDDDVAVADVDGCDVGLAALLEHLRGREGGRVVAAGHAGEADDRGLRLPAVRGRRLKGVLGRGEGRLGRVGRAAVAGRDQAVAVGVRDQGARRVRLDLDLKHPVRGRVVERPA